ncbi:MAG: hypothetical protein LBG13_02910, partial [Holosporales bacterium]|nr:hypothetical protein [Holosporales bacterium]
ETPAEAATTPEAPAVATEAAATPEAAAVPEAPAIPDIPNIAKINIRSGIYSPIQLSSAQSVQTLGNNSVIRVMINLPNPVLKEVNGSYDKSDETINLTPIINPDVVPYIASGRELFQALLSKVSVSPDDRQILEGVAVDQPDMADLKDLKVKPEFQTIWERLNNIPLFCIITFYIKDNVVERVEMTVSKAVKLFIMERDTINKKIRKAVEQYKSTVENLNYDVKDLEVVEAAMEKVKTLEAEMKTYLEEKEKVGQELENGPAVQKRKNALEGLEEEKKKRAEELATENKQLINAKESVGKDDGSSSAKKEEEIKKAEKKVADAEDEFGKAKKAAADAEIKAKAPKPTDRRGRPLSGFENVDKDYDAALSAQTAAENKFKRLQEELEAIRNTKTGPSKEEIEEKMSKIEEKLKANEKARADLEEEITRRSQEIEEEYNNDEELKSLRARLEVINSEMESKKEELSELRKKTEDKVTQLETLQHLRQVRSRKLNEELETECKRIDKELEGLEGIVKKSGGAAQEVALTLAAVGVATNGNSRDVAQSVNTLLSDPEQRKGIEEVAEGDKVLQIQAKNIVAALKNKDTNKE